MPGSDSRRVEGPRGGVRVVPPPAGSAGRV